MTGTYGTFDSTYGRATATFTSSHGESSGVLYMVSSSELILLQTSTDAPAQIGVVQQQTVPTGGFDNSSLSGNVVMYANGVNDSSSSGDAQIGLLSIPASGTVNVTVYDDAGNRNNNTPGVGKQLANSPDPELLLHRDVEWRGVPQRQLHCLAGPSSC